MLPISLSQQKHVSVLSFIYLFCWSYFYVLVAMYEFGLATSL
jgi:hypothetical protein